jgi:replicative DNA helicase
MNAHRTDGLRVPPQNIEAEQAVLGGLLLAPETLPEVKDIIQPGDFYRRDHKLIYEAILELDEKGKARDSLTVGEWFESNGHLGMVENGAYLVELATTTPSAANVREYAKIVADKSTLRTLADAGTQIVNDVFANDGREADDLVAEAAARVSTLTLRTAREGGLIYVRSGLKDAFQEMEDRNAGTIPLGLGCPWRNVGRRVPGLEDGDLWVVAGRPSMGKTAFGMEWADYAACQGRNVAVFSLEMSRRQLTNRLISLRAGVNLSHMRKHNGLTEPDRDEITRAMRELRDMNIAIDDRSGLTIDQLKSRALRMHAKVPEGVGLVVVDYLQLMAGTGREERRDQEISRISRGLKDLAKKLNCPVIALSQLNRSVESRTDKRPMMSDLKESGAIEQDADGIIFLYRDDYYTKHLCGAPGVAEAIIAKQRNGPTGTAYLTHHLECSHFGDYTGGRPDYSAKRAVNPSGDMDGFEE